LQVHFLLADIDYRTLFPRVFGYILTGRLPRCIGPDDMTASSTDAMCFVFTARIFLAVPDEEMKRI
jgi:hypothetical protein